ncbi:MAG: glycosyltransferase family 2 protein [Bacteroidota bacterium]
MTKLSVVIITFNEERNIGRCLESVKNIADDIVVVDSFSTDATEKICREHAVNFIQRKWDGYSATKNFANTQAKYDWVFSIDADEAFSEKLTATVKEWKEKEKNQPGKCNRLTNYCGKWVKHGGWYPDTKTRLFNRNTTRWEGEIHEELKMEKPENILFIDGDLLHYSYYTKEEHYRQADNFTTIMAQDLFLKNKKTNIAQILFSPVAKFVRDYFFNAGFMDGKTGFVIARISAKATYLKYKKLQQLHRNKK